MNTTVDELSIKFLDLLNRFDFQQEKVLDIQKTTLRHNITLDQFVKHLESLDKNIEKLLGMETEFRDLLNQSEIEVLDRFKRRWIAHDTNIGDIRIINNVEIIDKIRTIMLNVHSTNRDCRFDPTFRNDHKWKLLTKSDKCDFIYHYVSS
jgi:hypothetical protein